MQNGVAFALAAPAVVWSTCRSLVDKLPFQGGFGTNLAAFRALLFFSHLAASVDGSTASTRASPRHPARLQMRRQSTREPWEDAGGQILVGKAASVERMRGVLEAKLCSADHPAMQRLASRLRPAQVVEVVAEVFQSPADAIRNGRGTIELEVMTWRALL